MEITLPTHNTKKYTKKEAIIETLKWKLRFHEEQAALVRQQIKRIEEDD